MTVRPMVVIVGVRMVVRVRMAVVMRMGMSATAHRRVVKVIGPIWPTANRPTTEWAAQISVVITSNRIGFAQADCMSPVLGAVASVMTVFEDFEDRPKLTLGGMRSVTLERD